jgi:kynureninase
MAAPIELDYARQLDAGDDLAAYRAAFVQADDELIYMDGNSLGRLPHATVTRLRAAVEHEWGADLIRGWNHGWYEAPQRIGEKIAGLLGAGAGQVRACDSTSVNLFKLILAALALRPERRTIVSDALNFPSDLYIAQGCIDLLGGRHELRLAPSADGMTVDPAALYGAIDERTALVMLSHVVYKSGFLYDMAAVTARAHEVGALVLWDLSHSAGVVPIALDSCGVDFAAGCCYKYLNGGPGAPGYLYVRQDLQEQTRSPIWGWFGQRDPFAFDLDYRPAAGIDRFLSGTPPMLSLLAIEPALDMLLEAGVEPMRSKSVRLTEYAIELFDAMLAPTGYELGTPRDAARRGGHVTVRHPEGYRINRALIADLHVLPDFREPDNIRLGLAPLTTSFADVWNAIERMRRAVVERHYLRFTTERLAVT